jgi:hypothetical protein
MGVFDIFRPATGATLEDVRKANQEADPERVLYQTAMGGLERLQREQTAAFQAAREPQQAAVAALGQRAATLEGGAAQMAAQQSLETAQRSAPMGAILGGQIGQAQAQQIGELEQEAAARQAAYFRGLGALGTGLMTEAEERRRVEQAMLQDLQARYAGAMQQAQFQRQTEAAERQRTEAAILGAAGSGISMLAGGRK